MVLRRSLKAYGGKQGHGRTRSLCRPSRDSQLPLFIEGLSFQLDEWRFYATSFAPAVAKLAFISIRHALEAEGLLQILSKVAIGRLVLTSREHIIGLEPLGRGLMGTLLRYRTKCAMRMRRNTSMRVQDVKATKDTLLRRYQTDRLWRSRIL
jgi:hypothetical protein